MPAAAPSETAPPSPRFKARFPALFGRLLLLPFLILFAGAPYSPAFGQECTPDVNASNSVDADDALILYYAYSLQPVLGTGRGGGAGSLQVNSRDSGGETAEVSIAAASSTVAEGSPAVFILTASAGAQTAFTVNVEVTATGDFGVTTGEWPVAFGVGSTTAMLSVPTAGDNAVEAWGTVTAEIPCGANYRAGEMDTARVMVADDDVTVSIMPRASPVFEGSPSVFVLTASTGAETAFMVNVEVAATGDFGAMTGGRPVAFPAGETTVTLSVATKDDETPEVPGTVTATVEAGFGYVPGTSDTAEVTVADDVPSMQIAAPSSLVVEGSPAAFVLTTVAPAQTAFTVNVSVASTGDFGAPSGRSSFRFAAGETTFTVFVPTTGDEVSEALGTVSMTVEAGSDYSLGASATAQMKVADDDSHWKECSDCPEMVVVPSGTFTMGSPNNESGRNAHEGPQHQVTFAYRFAVGRYEVRFAEWDACYNAGGCSYSPSADWGRGNQPVIKVHWNDAQEYVRWLSEETGGTYRLLSEAEWEYATRAGSTTVRPWGDGSTSGKARVGHRTFPRSVGFYAPNAFGLYDVMGNVWEWTEDCYHNSYNNAPNDGRAWGSENGGNCDLRMARGAAFLNSSITARSSNRLQLDIDHRANALGFRVARELD